MEMNLIKFILNNRSVVVDHTGIDFKHNTCNFIKMGDLRPPGEKEIYTLWNGAEKVQFAKVWCDRCSPKSAACVSIWGEVNPSRARTSVLLLGIYFKLKVVHSLLLQPTWCWLVRGLVGGCRFKVTKPFWLVTTQHGSGPWTLDRPLFTAPLPVQQVAMYDCHAPRSTSNKKVGTTGKKSWLPISFRKWTWGFCGLMK